MVKSVRIALFAFKDSFNHKFLPETKELQLEFQHEDFQTKGIDEATEESKSPFFHENVLGKKVEIVIRCNY